MVAGMACLEAVEAMAVVGAVVVGAAMVVVARVTEAAAVEEVILAAAVVSMAEEAAEVWVMAVKAVAMMLQGQRAHR